MSPHGNSCENCAWRYENPEQYHQENRLPTSLHSQAILESVGPDRAEQLKKDEHLITGRTRLELFVLTGHMPDENSEEYRRERVRQLCCAARHGGKHLVETPEHMRNRQAPDGAGTALGPLPRSIA